MSTTRSTSRSARIALAGVCVLAAVGASGLASAPGAHAASDRQVGLAALDSVATSGPAAPGALVLDDGIGRAFALDTLRDELIVFDIGPSFLSRVATVRLGPSPSDVAVDTVGHRVVVADDVADTVSVVDATATTPAVVATFPTGSSDAEAIAVDGASSTVYVANQATDTVTVLHLDTGVATLVPVGDAPADVAVDPITHTVYVAEAGGASVSTIVGGAPGARAAVGATPRSLSVVGDRVLVATDELAPTSSVFRVRAYDRDLHELATSANLGARASGVAVDAQLRLVFVRTEVGELRAFGLDALDELTLTPPPVTGGQPRQVTVQQSTHRLLLVTTDRRTATVTLLGVAASPAFVPGILPPARVGMPYRARIEAVASPGPVSYSVKPVELPSGLVLDSATGEIRGTPRAAGTHSLLVTASNGSATPAMASFKIVVSP